MGGTIAFQSTGSPLDGIDNKTPTAFKDAEALVGSIADVSGDSGTYGIRYTLSDVLGTGVKLDYNYVPKHGSGDATGDEASSGSSVDANKDAHDVALTAAVPGIEGLNIGVGYSKRNYDYKSAPTGHGSREDGTAYVTYAAGPVTLGVQKGVQGDSGRGPQLYRNTYYGISYAVTDDFSVSYNNTESRKLDAGHAEQDWDGVSASYSMGGMTLNIAQSDCSNCSYSAGVNQEETAISLSVAF